MSTRDFVEKDYYKALGVAKDASQADIKKAYRKLARQFHPDANKGEAKAEERFKEVSAAYDVLSDPSKRKEYDDARALFGSGGFRTPTGAPGQGGGFSFDLGDLLGQRGQRGGNAGGGAGLGDLLGGLFGGSGRTAGRAGQVPVKGADIEAEVTLAFSDAVEGITAPLRLAVPGPCRTCAGSGAKPGTVPRVCPECSGTGTVGRNAGGFAFAEPCRECRGQGLIIDDPCPTCTGTGRTTRDRTLTVRIPAGVRDGQRIRIKSKGAPGGPGGAAGDLVVTVHVTPHPVFGRAGDNLTVSVPVTFPEATLGATIKVPTLKGAPVTLKLPPGTPTGRTMRVRGRGVTRKDGTRGDLLATVEVAVPRNVSGKAREALETFATEAGDDPRAFLMEAADRA